MKTNKQTKPNTRSQARLSSNAFVSGALLAVRGEPLVKDLAPLLWGERLQLQGCLVAQERHRQVEAVDPQLQAL